MSEKNALNQFVDTLKYRPTHLNQIHNLEDPGGLLWLRLHFRYPGKKMKGVGKWLVEIRDDLQTRGVSVREIKTRYNFLSLGAEPDPDVLVTAEFSVNSSEQLEDLNNAFIEAARELRNRGWEPK